MKFKAKEYKQKMSKEELVSYLQAKRSGNGAHRSKKDYKRKGKHRLQDDGSFFLCLFFMLTL